jgi:hypothetical protein
MDTMTLFEDNRYDWRETYFVYFESSHRPKLPEVRRALQIHAPFLCVLSSKADPNEYLVEMTVASYEDHAALEIIYQEGRNVLNEAKHSARSLAKGAHKEERLKLQKIAQCNMRLDVHHFEQLAETSVFNITKIPEIKFPKHNTSPPGHGNVFLRALQPDTTDKGQFYFDPNFYEQCRHDRAGEELDTANAIGMDSGEFERINPETLVTVLEILCRLSRGVALDPASGIVLE